MKDCIEIAVKNLNLRYNKQEIQSARLKSILLTCEKMSMKMKYLIFSKIFLENITIVWCSIMILKTILQLKYSF
jgi:hypothetical protein